MVKGASGKAGKGKSADNRGRSGQALYAVVGEDLLKALDTWVDRLNASGTGPTWTRQDVVRAALIRAVKERGEKGEAP